MHKLLIIISILLTTIYANDKVEIYATKMDSQNQVVNASGEVVVVYKDYVLSAKRAIYDKDTGELELFGNIHATQGNDYKILGDYAKMNIAKKERSFKPFYMLERKSNVWISGKESSTKDTDVNIKSGVVSSCNPNNPLWKMEFTSSEYNTESKWLNLYNTKLYIYDILVFYTPYFGYSLDNTRRSGLLMPAVGLSSKEGFYFEQPIYIAESNWWDLEIKPQVRTSRGYGIYSTFRFIDSPISRGSLTAGYFKEQDKYFKDNNLANDSHYGFNFKYNNTDVINQWFGSKLDGQSGLYIDINSMNDVDYINLATNDITNNAVSTQVLSRVNLFYNTQDNYIGAYFKYYRDLTIDSNNETLQKLPTVQYHSYLDTFFDDHLLYNLDVQSNYLSRSLGKTALQTDINLPITFQTPMFDENLNVSYTAYLYAQYSTFGGNENLNTGEISRDYNDGYFARNYHVLTVSTQQTKAYEELIHVVDLGVQYVVGGAENNNGYYKDQKDYCSDNIHRDEDICEFYNIQNIDENLQLYFSQYVYGDDGQQIIYHRLAQNISYETSKNQVGELENELEYQISKNVNYYNNMFFNYKEGAFSKNFNQITYMKESVNLSLSHMYKRDFDNFVNNTSYVTSSLRFDYGEHYTYMFRYDYDLELSQKKSTEIGFLYKKRCWDFGLRYVENNRPVLSNIGGADSIYDRYIYITITLKPFMSSANPQSAFAFRLPGDR